MSEVRNQEIHHYSAADWWSQIDKVLLNGEDITDICARVSCKGSPYEFCSGPGEVDIYDHEQEDGKRWIVGDSVELPKLRCKSGTLLIIWHSREVRPVTVTELFAIAQPGELWVHDGAGNGDGKGWYKSEE